MAEPAKKKARTRPRPTRGVAFTLWSANGGSVPPEIVIEIEARIADVTLGAFNEGHRLLTQTTRG